MVKVQSLITLYFYFELPHDLRFSQMTGAPTLQIPDSIIEIMIEKSL
jgi:hypothetical protein